VIQIAGADPEMMAEAAKYNVDSGADIIDINMGCPAKKICNVYAGSALLKDEPLVARIVDAVVRAVDVPVTLKIRTGWDKGNRNALMIARIAEDHGIQSLAMHGRTRACMYTGDAEYDTIRAVKQAVRIPVVANGDITTPEKGEACARLHRRRRHHDRPRGPGTPLDLPRDRALPVDRRQAGSSPVEEIREVMVAHLHDLYAFYGYERGVRVARKHIGWYTRG
jgi:tRNA-dihydrouridine synthase B